MNDGNSPMNVMGDTLSVSILIGYFLSALPTIALILTVIWTGIRIYETDTVQRLLGRKHGTRID